MRDEVADPVARPGALEAQRHVSKTPDGYSGQPKRWPGLGLWRLPGAARFSSDPALCDPLRLIAEWRRQPFAVLLRELSDTSPTAGGGIEFSCPDAPKLGRPRLAGDWPAAYLAYVLSRSPSLQTWFNQSSSSPLWQICGFERMPAYQTAYLRFTELEGQWQAFASVAQQLVRVAKGAESRIGRSSSSTRPVGDRRRCSNTPVETRRPACAPAATPCASSAASPPRRRSPATGR